MCIMEVGKPVPRTAFFLAELLAARSTHFCQGKQIGLLITTVMAFAPGFDA